MSYTLSSCNNFDVFFQDEHLAIIEKKEGAVVHHGAGVDSGTIEDDLALALNEKQKAELELYRYGIVHRLDKDTSGLMIIGKTPDVCQSLTSLFKEHKINKTYIAITKGMIEKNKGEITTNIKRSDKNRKKFTVCNTENGKTAYTSYNVLRYFGVKATFVELNIKTGRTHQIRVHLASLNHPVLGDVIYSRKSKDIPDYGLMLHAKKLEFTHPISNEQLIFETKIPQRMNNMIRFLENAG